MTEKVELEVASKQSVALQLTRVLEHTLNSEGNAYRKDYLDLYVECLSATNGYRAKE